MHIAAAGIDFRRLFFDVVFTTSHSLYFPHAFGRYTAEVIFRIMNIFVILQPQKSQK